jgi:hypothetical protein
MKLSEITYHFDTPAEIEIKNPENGKSFKKPAFISVMSIESEAGRKIQMDIYRDAIDNKEDNKINKHLAKLITSWRGIEDEDGKEIEYSYDNAVVLLDNPIIFKIVNNSTATMSNFKKK